MDLALMGRRRDPVEPGLCRCSELILLGCVFRSRKMDLVLLGRQRVAAWRQHVMDYRLVPFFETWELVL
jgi:hypothetical protein